MSELHERVEALKSRVATFHGTHDQSDHGNRGSGLRDTVKKLKDKIGGGGKNRDSSGSSDGEFTETRKARDLKPGDDTEHGVVKENLGTDLLGDQMILTDKGEYSLGPNEDVKTRPTGKTDDLSSLSDDELRVERKKAQQEIQRVSRLYDNSHPAFMKARKRQLELKREVARRQSH